MSLRYFLHQYLYLFQVCFAWFIYLNNRYIFVDYFINSHKYIYVLSSRPRFETITAIKNIMLYIVLLILLYYQTYKYRRPIDSTMSSPVFTNDSNSNSKINAITFTVNDIIALKI